MAYPEHNTDSTAWRPERPYGLSPQWVHDAAAEAAAVRGRIQRASALWVQALLAIQLIAGLIAGFLAPWLVAQYGADGGPLHFLAQCLIFGWVQGAVVVAILGRIRRDQIRLTQTSED